MSIAEKKTFWASNPLSGTIALSVQGVGDLLMECQNDDTVVRELFWTEGLGWERTSLQLWSRLCRSLDDHDVVFDIGSYTGIYGILAAKLSSAKAYALDIQQVCIDRVRANAELNDVSVEARCLAASDSDDEEIEFYHGSDAGLISSVASLKPNEYSPDRAVCATSKLDTLVSIEHLAASDVRLVKIDVEGAERFVLRGMAEVLSQGQPDVLVEVNQLRELPLVLKHFPRSYRCYQIDDSASRGIHRFTIPRRRGRNYWLTCRDKDDTKRIIKSLPLTI